MKKFLSFIFAFILVLNTVILPANALYRGVLGDVYYTDSRQIGAGVDFTLYRSLTDGLNERAYVFEYRPGEGALPIVTYGDYLMGSNRLSSHIKNESEKGNNVIGGINGDFYSVYTGIPMGALISDSRIVSDDDKNNAIGFNADGTTILGSPDINFTVIHTYDASRIPKSNAETDAEDTEASEDNAEVFDELSDDEEFTEEVTEEDYDSFEDDSDFSDDEEFISEVLPVSYFNKYPTEWGAYLLDDMFDKTTRSSKPSLEIVIELDDTDAYAAADQCLTGKIIQINREATDTGINKGQLVISVNEKSSYRSAYNNIEIGDEIEIHFSLDENWTQVVTAIGGSDLIVVDGQINREAINESHEKIANPRTAVGVRSDGTVIFFAVDGRSDDSYGLRMVSLAETLISFGCVYALNLDGGGSTTAAVKYPDSEIGIINTPSDSAERSVANALLLVDNTESDGIPKYIIPSQSDTVILPGESYSFDGKFYDSALKPVSGTSLTNDDVRIGFDYSRLSYYTEENMPYLGSITDDGKTFIADGATGEIPLLFTAEYEGETLTGRMILFVAPAPDTVEVRLGGVVYSENSPITVEFDAFYMGTPVPARPYHLTYNLTDNQVRQSGIVDDAPLKRADSSLGYISESGEFIPYENADGSVWLTISLDSIPVAQTLLAVGKPKVSVLDNVSVEYNFAKAEETETSDIVFYSDLPLDGADSLDLYISESDLILKAVAFDNNSNENEIEFIRQINEESSDGIYHYRAPLDKNYLNLSKGLLIKESDNTEKSGNIDIKSLLISFEDTETLFYDTYNHWARKNINSLYRSGIVGGEEFGGKLRFAPDRTLSRAEFAVMISRSLGYNTDEYTNELEFADNAKIPAWAAPFIRAVSENGIMNGKRIDESTLNFDPDGKITRQEIMQVIGNIIKKQQTEDLIRELEEIAEEKGEETGNEESVIDDIADTLAIESELSSDYVMPSFKDADQIALWALENVQLTVEAGIVGGYSDNTLKPAFNVTRAEAATIILRTINYFDN